MSLTFVDSPPDSRRMGSKYNVIGIELRKNPHKWAMVAKGAGYSNYVRRTLGPEFSVTERKVDSCTRGEACEVQVWASYTG
jgi:hypothetical protein